MTESGVISWAAAVDARIWQAVIAGVFLAAGWLVNGWQNRKAAAALRAEKLRDYHRALYAEIGANLANLWDTERLEGYRDRMVAKMEADANFVPFIPIERHDAVFDALIADVHILPRQTIDPIVLYYAQVKSVAALAADMRAEGFGALAQDRRIAMYRDYIAMKVQLLAFGRYANALINAFSKGGADAARAEAQRLNTRARAPSDRSGE
ncbi:hypothetical protein [Sulfitobacter sp. JB4-11]|uniref:hypothetical protein n=1 Tax=Sulfitobacter rhodophyticola TaxID=3238304 RepID=UPI00351779C8